MFEASIVLFYDKTTFLRPSSVISKAYTYFTIFFIIYSDERESINGDITFLYMDIMDYARIIQSIMHFPRLKWTDKKNKLPIPSISSITSLLLTSHFLCALSQIKITEIRKIYRQIHPEFNARIKSFPRCMGYRCSANYFPLRETWRKRERGR